ncbi:hypothetical protein [Wolbachia endosymbiont (group A) of Urophora cardui]
MPMMKIRWIPVSSTGMTGVGAGMTKIDIEMTKVGNRVTPLQLRGIL